MEPDAKKIKLETFPEPLEFLGMNDDCIMHVLDKLHKTDICSISFACKRLQELAYAVHMRRYPNKSITIKPIMDLKSRKFNVGFSETTETYLKYMSKAVRNVEMQCTRKGIRDYFKFLKSQCCQNLKSLKIYRARVNLSSIPWNMIKDQLKYVVTLSIETLPAKSISTPHKNWLACCEKLRELSIVTQFCNGEWLLDVYPELESLSIHLLKIDVEKDTFGKYASQFFERQPKLKEIKCVGINTTQLLLQNVKNIPRLTVICNITHSGNIEQFADAFKTHSERGSIDWLEFDLDHEIGEYHRLSEVDAVHPVNGLRTKLLGSIGQSMIEMQLKHLVHLELIVEPYGDIDWTRLSKNLPHLETLKLSFENSHFQFDIARITMPLIGNMPKLKRLDVQADESAIFSSDHLCKLNSARLLVKNAVHLQVNFELLRNKCKMIIPTSNILTVNIIRNGDIEEDSSSDDDDSVDDSDDDRVDDSDDDSDDDDDIDDDDDSSSSSDDSSDYKFSFPMFFFSALQRNF